MRKLLLLSALLLGACSYLPASVNSGLNSVQTAVGNAGTWMGGVVSTAANAVFCNPYASRAFDASEAKNQPKCGG